MAGVVARGMRRIGYRRARLLLLVVGLGVLLVVAGLAYARRVETVELVASLLFIPVFVAALFWGIPGGVVAAILAAGVYVALRLPAIEAVGLAEFAGLIASRAAALVVFGALVGWAARVVGGSVRKLEEHDQIDDLTGLLNARFFLIETDLETARSTRYRTIFSVSAVGFPTTALRGSARRARRTLRELAREIRGSVRTVDRVVHALDGDRHTIAVILPETGAEGAEIFSARLAERVRGRLSGGELSVRTLTYPEHESELAELREAMRRIDRSEHPEAEPPATPDAAAGAG